MHTTQTICKLHERNAREEVLNSSQFIKLQKVKVKADRAFGICRCITAHILSEETKDMGSIGYCLNLFSKKNKKIKKTSLVADIRSEKAKTTESKYFVLNKLFLEFPCL